MTSFLWKPVEVLSGKYISKRQFSKPSLIFGLLFGLLSNFNTQPAVKAGFLNPKPKAAQERKSDKKENSGDDNVPEKSNSSPSLTIPYSDEAVKHYNHGVELHQAGFLNQAIGEYRAAIEADNRMEEAYSNLGIIYAAQRNYPHAKEAFEQALKLRPNRPTTLNGLGTVLYAQGLNPQAMDKWKEALADDPKFASALYNMGNAYEGQKNYGDAKACYFKAINAVPSMADAYFRLGNIMIREHHWAQAEVLLKKAIELAPDGEFVREAKHSLSIIESHFEKTKVKVPPPQPAHKKQ